jgi:hypothetical protein
MTGVAPWLRDRATEQIAVERPELGGVIGVTRCERPPTGGTQMCPYGPIRQLIGTAFMVDRALPAMAGQAGGLTPGSIPGDVLWLVEPFAGVKEGRISRLALLHRRGRVRLGRRVGGRPGSVWRRRRPCARSPSLVSTIRPRWFRRWFLARPR